jgi:hypothetical protein
VFLGDAVDERHEQGLFAGKVVVNGSLEMEKEKWN